jgi:hypothetical protein
MEKNAKVFKPTVQFTNPLIKDNLLNVTNVKAVITLKLTQSRLVIPPPHTLNVCPEQLKTVTNTLLVPQLVVLVVKMDSLMKVELVKLVITFQAVQFTTLLTKQDVPHVLALPTSTSLLQRDVVLSQTQLLTVKLMSEELLLPLLVLFVMTDTNMVQTHVL